MIHPHQFRMNIMSEKDSTPPKAPFPFFKAGLFGMSLAGYAVTRKNYSASLRFYQKTGGGGINIYKKKDGQSKRFFAIDYHPFWNPAKKESSWKLHYHRGENSNQMKKHRPYQGW